MSNADNVESNATYDEVTADWEGIHESVLELLEGRRCQFLAEDFNGSDVHYL